MILVKNFLTSVKGKIIAGIITSGIIGASVSAVLLMNIGYRVISVQAMNGLTQIVNGTKTNEAYIGLHLKNGDDVTVSDTGDLTLSLDTDKYVYAEPKTHFWIEAMGKRNDTRTTIHLEEGSQLFRIDNKLKGDEFFNVETPNSTMSVRGTVFRVACFRDETGELITQVEVYEGAVYTEPVTEDGEKTGDSKVIEPDTCAKIHSNPALSEFVVDEEGNDVFDIDYSELPQDSAKFIGQAIDAGRDVCIEKDLLYDFTEIEEHRFNDKKIVKTPTCEEEGYYYPVCVTCGKVKREKIEIPKLKHTVVEEEVPATEDEPAHTVKKCADCGEIIKEVTPKPDNSESAASSASSSSNSSS